MIVRELAVVTDNSVTAREAIHMPYAEGRTYQDADSHIHEIPGWIEAFADPAIRHRIPALDFSLTGNMADAALALEGRTGHDPETVAELEKNVIGGKKGWKPWGRSMPESAPEPWTFWVFSVN